MFCIAWSTLCPSCLPETKHTEPDRVWEIDPRSLHNSYVDGSDRWTNRVVKITLAPQSYRIGAEGLHWHAEREVDPPSILFVGGTKPPHTKHTVEIVGMCRGSARRPPSVRVEVSTLTVK